MKRTLIGLFSYLVIMAFLLGTAVTPGKGERELPYPSANQNVDCLAPAELTNALAQLSGAYAEAQQARAVFLKAAASSPTCKERIIKSIMIAMDIPDLDIRRDQASYYLWREGSELLGELGATEALDLLISHLGMNDGEWSASMVHQPALGGIIKMGSISIPKLSVVLRSSDRNLRRDSVYCIAMIGGPTAMSVLKQALPTESDQCIRQLIRTSISSLSNEKNMLKDKGEWFAATLCK